jgi:hypothetical protein
MHASTGLGRVCQQYSSELACVTVECLPPYTSCQGHSSTIQSRYCHTIALHCMLHVTCMTPDSHANAAWLVTCPINNCSFSCAKQQEAGHVYLQMYGAPLLWSGCRVVPEPKVWFLVILQYCIADCISSYSLSSYHYCCCSVNEHQHFPWVRLECC